GIRMTWTDKNLLLGPFRPSGAYVHDHHFSGHVSHHRQIVTDKHIRHHHTHSQVNLQLQHKRRLLLLAQFHFPGLADGMVEYTLAHASAIPLTFLPPL
uniref:hypothetical protein n=1 Tax=Salmonella enterica TaxID=28901 RepID=UPI00398C3243